MAHEFQEKIILADSMVIFLYPLFYELFLNICIDRSVIFESTQGVDTRQFYPVLLDRKRCIRKQLNLPAETVILISVGYIIKRKGFEQVFKVLIR